MPSCARCNTTAPGGSRYCPACGDALAPSTRSPTEVLPLPSATPVSMPSGGRFATGTVLAGRYRIVGKLGQGGMGEVYRAEDLTLGQTVALKFLPPQLADDPRRMERFLTEVRIARQITHSNVCSVYDIGETEGERFISMEYVDGEDLASLLRRIGRYSKDKAAEIGRQICAGLAAAHDRGVLHRDLKPANIMIDGRGKVRITDFGLAALAGEVSGDRIREGTPAYMAPEQLTGRQVTLQSDIYALGLVLYELFTGRPAHRAVNREELLRSHSSGSVTSPSSHVDDIDAAAERIILRCLEQDPRDRPASALAVATSLPGGDPLAAALAAGETPSPELVAGSGVEGALRPAVAWTLLATAIVLYCVLALAAGSLSIVRQVDLPLPPAALEIQARSLIRDLGHEAVAADTATGFQGDDGPVDWTAKQDESADRWESLRDLRPAPYFFWYRQSPRTLVARPNFTVVTYDEPPQALSGMARVRLDPDGRLRTFEAIPPRHDDDTGPWPEPDWSLLFDEAGLDPASFTRVPPAWTPAMASDVQVAWEGARAERPDVTLRVEAAGYRGKPVSFEILGPWAEPPRQDATTPSLVDWLADNLGLAVMVIGALVLGSVLARRNLRAGRSDTRGALRLAFWFFVLHTVVWALWASHVYDLGAEWYIIQADVGYNLFLAANLWLLYVALEPFVRRRWPDAIISWSRLLRGRFRDPLIGRDILVGGVLGGVMGLLMRADDFLTVAVGRPVAEPYWGNPGLLEGASYAVGFVLDRAVHSLLDVMQGVFILLLLRTVLRKVWLTGAVFAVLIGLAQGAPRGDNPVVSWIQIALIVVAVLFVISRYGLLATSVGLFISTGIEGVMLPSDLAVWYAPWMLIPLAATLALLGYGFYTALAGQPLFGAARFLDD